MKTAYPSKPAEIIRPIRNMPLLSEGLPSHTDNAGRNAINLQEMTADIEGHVSEEQQEKLLENWPEEAKDPEGLADFFVWLADELDSAGETKLADFADFMISKCAQVQEEPSSLFRDLLLRVNEAELINSKQILVRLAKVYGRVLKSNSLKKIDLEESKRMAYQKSLVLARAYLEQSYE